MDTTLWIAQVFLGLFFLVAGAPKLLNRGLDRWVGFDALPRPMTVTIGVAEVVAAFALVVPMLVDEVQWTTPLAALGLVAVMLPASGFHVRAQEWLSATEAALWALLSGAVAIGRWDLVASGSTVSAEVLVPLLFVLGVAIVANLVVLLRRPVAPAPARSQGS